MKKQKKDLKCRNVMNESSLYFNFQGSSQLVISSSQEAVEQEEQGGSSAQPPQASSPSDLGQPPPSSEASQVTLGGVVSSESLEQTVEAQSAPEVAAPVLAEGAVGVAEGEEPMEGEEEGGEGEEVRMEEGEGEEEGGKVEEGPEEGPEGQEEAVMEVADTTQIEGNRLL